MKRIAPSREMSGMTFIFAVLILIFGIFVLSSVPGGGGFFGIIFILAGVFLVIYHLNNAVGKKRIPLYDVVDDSNGSKRYPLDNDYESKPASQKEYCPWCGEMLDNSEYRFCPKCGKRM